ncbi:MAG: DUF423 domain-containing protein [Gammaproteobacteria bacterium]|nr:DUF423 domain-containing protein [Gammaproteobacteria bacterium]
MSLSAARTIFALGAAGALTAVIAGAFGAHGLRHRLDADLLAVFLTGAQYQMYHSLALLAVGAAQASDLRSRWFGRAALSFVAGMILFSGSLYLLAFTGMRQLGAITPIGGVLFLLGWILLMVGAWRERD